MADWLAAAGVPHAGLESTGAYRRPAFHVLGGRLALLPVSAQHLKQVPGCQATGRRATW